MSCPNGPLTMFLDGWSKSMLRLLSNYKVYSQQDLYGIYSSDRMMLQFRQSLLPIHQPAWDRLAPKRVEGLQMLMAIPPASTPWTGYTVHSADQTPCPFGKLKAACVNGFNSTLVMFLQVHQVTQEQVLFEIYRSEASFQRFRRSLDSTELSYWDTVAPSRETGLRDLSHAGKIPVYVAQPENVYTDTPTCQLKWITAAQWSSDSAQPPLYYNTPQECEDAHPFLKVQPLITNSTSILTLVDVMNQYYELTQDLIATPEKLKQQILILFERLSIQNSKLPQQEQVRLNPARLVKDFNPTVELWRLSLMPRFENCFGTIHIDTNFFGNALGDVTLHEINFIRAIESRHLHWTVSFQLGIQVQHRAHVVSQHGTTDAMRALHVIGSKINGFDGLFKHLGTAVASGNIAMVEYFIQQSECPKLGYRYMDQAMHGGISMVRFVESHYYERVPREFFCIAMVSAIKVDKRDIIDYLLDPTTGYRYECTEDNEVIFSTAVGFSMERFMYIYQQLPMNPRLGPNILKSVLQAGEETKFLKLLTVPLQVDQPLLRKAFTVLSRDIIYVMMNLLVPDPTVLNVELLNDVTLLRHNPDMFLEICNFLATIHGVNLASNDNSLLRLARKHHQLKLVQHLLEIPVITNGPMQLVCLECLIDNDLNGIVCILQGIKYDFIEDLAGVRRMAIFRDVPRIMEYIENEKQNQERGVQQ
jgi:hypothetical protein